MKPIPTLILPAIPLLPLASFLLLSLLGRHLPRRGDWLALLTGTASFAAAVTVFVQVWPDQEQYIQVEWFQLTSYIFRLGLWADRYSALMCLLVTFVSLLVQIYSVGYMKGQPRYSQYFAYLGLFTSAMLGIVLADNLFLLYGCWELVGLSSYLLIGFRVTNPAAARGSRNAFFINRIGDAGFLIALLMILGLFGSSDLRFLTREALLPLNTSWSLVFGLGLLCGTIAKSAQFPLQIWLPGAMAGPTPVSALIHAATMVAAGVYLLVRLFPLLDNTILNLAAGIGTVTLFMGAVAALFQTDIKRLLAFSTVSQLGYMVMAVGIGAPGAAMFHLVTHAFFKAGLFLCAGSVIHALHQAGHQTHIHFDAQDMRLMGGLRRKMPVTFLCFTICGLALAGVPLFSGFLSKDAILAASLGWAAGAAGGLAYLVPLLGFLSALLTACYVGRQLVLVFRDKFRLNEPAVYAVVDESPIIMLAPVILLSLLSLFFVFSVNPLNTGWLYQTLATGEPESHGWHARAVSISISLAAGGLLITYFFVNRSLFFIPTPLRELSRRNWYLDDAFRLVVILPGKLGARIVRQLDSKVLDAVVGTVGMCVVVLAHMTAWFDRFVVDGAVRLAALAAGRIGMTVRAGSGQVQTYVAAAVLTFIALLVWLVVSGVG